MAEQPEKEQPTGLDLLRAPFPPHLISKLPKETRAQIDARKENKNLMVWNCAVCGGHHHRDAVHLDYVGHAALTDRLLDCDPEWSWEPFALAADGGPLIDRNGGLWIRLTVCGVTRIGYGDADGKSGGNAVKEAIGDALRNAAMRFGAALDLWHKGDLHGEDEQEQTPQPIQASKKAEKDGSRLTKAMSRDLYEKMQAGMRKQSSAGAIRRWLEAFDDTLKTLPVDQEQELRTEAQQEIEAHEASQSKPTGAGF